MGIKTAVAAAGLVAVLLGTPYAHATTDAGVQAVESDPRGFIETLDYKYASMITYAVEDSREFINSHMVDMRTEYAYRSRYDKSLGSFEQFLEDSSRPLSGQFAITYIIFSAMGRQERTPITVNIHDIEDWPYDDIASLILDHEETHAKDYFYGIVVDDLKVDHQNYYNYHPNTLRVVVEARASTNQLSKVMSGERNISQWYYNHVMRNLLIYYQKLEIIAAKGGADDRMLAKKQVKEIEYILNPNVYK